MSNTRMSQKPRSLTIDALKGAAILLVMLGHVLVWNHMEDGILYDVIKVIQRPLFILVSGYLCGMGQPVAGLSAYGIKLKKRALAYLTPFSFWIVLQHPLHPFSNIWETLFGLDRGLWFLMTLFLLTWMIYTAELAGSLAGKKLGSRAEKGCFWLVYLGLAAFVVLETLWGIEFLSPGLTRLYLPFYLTGYLAGKYRKKLAESPEILKNAGGLLSLGGLLVMAVQLDLQDVTTLFLLGRQIIASFLGCVAVCWLLVKCKPNRFKKALAWLGGYTLEIYVVHFHFATVLNRGQVYAQYSAGWFLFVIASFIVMSAITAAVIAVTKRIRLLDFLLYGKWPENGRFFGKQRS